ncbi:helix-turn-helix domain-containing protein [Mycolicibacterium goodii]|uniref:helix-turn-helix domain-containing protein n=1 Tax=Mycolicibacterium goodii TaxID=134601 RepID=UPI0035561519
MLLRDAKLLKALVGSEKDKVMSGRRLARCAGVHPSFINHLLSGRRNSCTPQTADRIAEALGVPTVVLFEERLTTGKQANDKPRKAAVA